MRTPNNDHPCRPDPKPMLVPDLNVLRRKLRTARGSLADKWRTFQALAEHQAEAFPTYSAFQALIAGDQAEPERFAQASEAAARRFREALERKLLSTPSYCRSLHVQFHTWCFANPLARWAIAYDWVADHPAFAGFDHLRAADTFLDAAHSQIYPRVFAREPSGDNQIASMLLACGVIGYLFGVKRGRDPRAQAMFRTALERCHSVAEAAEPQFVGEGSVYMLGVNVAAMGLWLALLEWLEQPHDHAKWLSCQVSARQLAGPGGLTLPWDAGGLARHFGMAGLALLARETGDMSALAMLDRFNMWRGMDHGAWFDDQRIWTLIWWPEDAPDWPAREFPPEDVFPGWMHPAIGGAMDAPGAGLRVFQAWDICAGDSIGGVIRPNTDPNALHVEIGGTPLSLDGTPGPDCRAFDYAPEDVLRPDELQALRHDLALWSAVEGREVSLAERIRLFAHGTLGGSNALVFNDEPWHYPRKLVRGRGTLWARLPGVQAVAADCTAHYTPAYPVQRVERTSILLDSRLVLVLDEIDSREALDVSWQMHVRPEKVTIADDGASVETPEGPRLRIFPAGPDTLKTERIDGYPETPSNGSQRVSWRQRLDRGILATLLAPEDDEAVCANDSVWSGGFTDLDAGAPERLPSLTEAVVEGDLNTVVDAVSAAPANRWRLLRAEIQVPQGADYLRLPVLNVKAGVWWSGDCIARPDLTVGSWSRTIPLALPARGKARAELIVAVQSERGCLLTEPGVWYRRTTPRKIQFRPGLGRWEIVAEGTSFTVYSRAAARQSGWETDARWLIAKDGALEAVLDCTYLRGRGLAEALAVETSVHATRAGGGWHVCPAALPADEPPIVIRPTAMDLAPGRPCAHVRSSGRTVGETLTLRDLPELMGRLNAPDWRVIRTAAMRLGELGNPAACQALRERLAQELEAESLNPVVHDCEPTTWEADMAAVGRDPGCKAFRVAQALLMALHRLGDREAAPLAREALGNWNHFYPVYNAALNLLADLGGPEDLDLLRTWSSYPEVNARKAAERALSRLAAADPRRYASGDERSRIGS